MVTPEVPSTEKVYSLKDVHDGQAQINYVLNHVDMKLIDSLKVIVEVLKTLKDLPQFTRLLNQFDLTKMADELSLAQKHSDLVASIKPPGCEPPPPPYPY